MSQHKDAINLIKVLTGQANILTIPRVFVDYMGSLDSALFLSQVIFWSDKGHDGWFYKSYADWKSEVCLSRYEVDKCTKLLKDRNLLSTKVKRANGAPTIHYQFRFADFSKSICEFLQMDMRETDKSCNIDHNIDYSIDSPPPQTPEKTQPDYLEDCVTRIQQGNNGKNGIATPADDLALYFQYKDAAIKAYLDQSGKKFIPPATEKAITDLSATPGFDLDFWRQVVGAWIKQGWNPSNVQGMIDFYNRNELPKSNGGNRGKRRNNDHAAKPAGPGDGVADQLEKALRSRAKPDRPGA